MKSTSWVPNHTGPTTDHPSPRSFLSGAKEESKLFFKTEDFYAEQSIELHLGAEAASLDPSSQHRNPIQRRVPPLRQTSPCYRVASQKAAHPRLRPRRRPLSP